MSRFAFMMVLAFYGLGILWCREMFPRWREDLGTLRDPQQEGAEKIVALLLWGLTGMFIIGMMLVTFYLMIQLKNTW